MKNSFFVLFFVIFLIGCTELPGNNGNLGSGRQGVQIEFTSGFPSKTDSHPISEKDLVPVRFILNNYGATGAVGTASISEISGYSLNLGEQPVQFALEGLREGVKTKDSKMLVAYRPYGYPKEAFDTLVKGLLQIRLEYRTEAELSGDVCVRAVDISENRGINTCADMETIQGNAIRNSNTYSVGIAKIEKEYINQAVGDGNSLIKLIFHFKDDGGSSSSIDGKINDFKVDLLGGTLRGCDKEVIDFKQKDVAELSCQFIVHTDQKDNKMRYQITYSYLYKVTRTIDIPFEK